MTGSSPTASLSESTTAPNRGRLFARRLVVLLLVAGVAGAAWSTRQRWLPAAQGLLVKLKLVAEPGAKAPPPPRVIAVATARVSRRSVDYFLTGLGTVTPFRTVTIRPRVEGELIKIAFTEGQTVKQGDLLAQIDPRLWQAQLEQAQGQLARDDAVMRSTNRTLLRYRQLAEAKKITPQELDDQIALTEQAAAAVRIDAALVANAELQLSYCEIKAPIEGRIGLRLVDQGNVVRQSDPAGIAVITQLKPIAVVFTIPQDEIQRILAQMPSGEGLVVEAFDRDLRQKLAVGKLAAVDNQVDPATGTLKLKAVFPNDDEALFPNQFVNVKLLVETEPDAIVAPTAAVQRGPDASFAYVLKPDSTVDRRPLRIGGTEGTDTVIREGLLPGDQVVVQGLDQLRPGSKVSVKSPGGSSAPSGNAPGDPSSNRPQVSDRTRPAEATGRIP